MNKLQLEYFIEVCNCQKVSKAAEKLHVSRQALSRTIHDLEKELNTNLFRRSKKGMEMTQDAYELYSHAVNILREYTLIMKTSTLETLEKNEIRIFVFDSMLELFTTEFFREFLQEFPGIILNLEEVSDVEAIEAVRKGIAHMAIVTDAVDFADFYSTYLFFADYGILVHESSPLAKKEYLQISDLKGQRVIGKSRQIRYFMRDVNYLLDRGAGLNFIMESSNSALDRRLVEDNFASAMIWDYFAGQYPQNGKIIVKSLIGPEFGCDVYLVMDKLNIKNDRLNSVKRFIVEWLKERTHTRERK